MYVYLSSNGYPSVIVSNLSGMAYKKENIFSNIPCFILPSNQANFMKFVNSLLNMKGFGVRYGKSYPKGGQKGGQKVSKWGPRGQILFGL